MNLDDDLRRMFTNVDDDRLDVAIRPDAEQVIVAGARRVRRRRIMTVTASGAAAVAVLVVGGILLTGMKPEAMPPAAEKTRPPSVAQSDKTVSSLPPSSTLAPSSATQTQEPPPKTADDPPPSEAPEKPAVTGEEIGPNGFRDVRMGMTYDEVLATGMIDAPKSEDPGCMQYALLVGGGYVHISEARGVEAIGPDIGLHTPEGVSTGWTVEQVKAVYPELDLDLVAEHSRDLVAVPGNGSAVYRLYFTDGKLATISLQLRDQTCYE